MKYLLMCEGTNEETIMNLLLNNHKLVFSRDDLIGLKPYHIRNLKSATIKSELKHYNQPVIIYRIGDKQNDKLEIPSDLKHIVSEKNIFRYCTKPELEILMIINENLVSDFAKSKNTGDAKGFAKDKIKYNGRRYNQSSKFIEEYYEGNIDHLVANLIEYKRIKKHKKDELYLADLLNSQSTKNKKKKPVR